MRGWTADVAMCEKGLSDVSSGQDMITTTDANRSIIFAASGKSHLNESSETLSLDRRPNGTTGQYCESCVTLCNPVGVVVHFFIALILISPC